MNDLEQRDITPDDYDVLLQLENQKNQGNLAKYMVLNYVDDDTSRSMLGDVECAHCK
jgi:hypothetical protein